jgi:halimadienyl-diphosphate synthase
VTALVRLSAGVPQRRSETGGALCDCPAAAADLLDAVQAKPWGTLSPSIYETARLITLAPWLHGHRARLAYLLDRQLSDGGWGGPGAYALVPTLSATEALLASLVSPGRRPLPRMVSSQAELAAARGLARSHRLLRSLTADDLPDTPAIEIIVPFLVALIGHRLDHLPDPPVVGLDRWRGRVRLSPPAGVDDAPLRGLREILGRRQAVPLKTLHSLEVGGELSVGARGVPRGSTGMVGASPAATAAWLGTSPLDRSNPGHRYLRGATAQHGGPVPSVIPITSFERAWVINSLAMAGIRVEPRGRLVREMLATIGPRGVSGGSGLPPDADTTSATLCALGHLGVPTRPGVLRRFDLDTHFCTWVGERTGSSTTNAHVLAALAKSGGRRSGWRTSAIQRTVAWLCDQQAAGAWSDKWHASPYYATMCTVAALRDTVLAETALPAMAGARVGEAVDRAVAWVLASQRRDGSWGRFAGTAEETAYALQILLYRARPGRPSLSAASRGHRFLVSAEDVAMPPLWHDKDLYTPTLVVRAAVLSARHLVHSLPATATATGGVRAVPTQRRGDG